MPVPTAYDQPEPLQEAEQIELSQTAGPMHTGLRLDQVAAQMFPEYSRARLQEWIKEGQLTLNGEVMRAKDKVLEGDQVVLMAEMEAAIDFKPETMALDIVYEDDDVIVVVPPASSPRPPLSVSSPSPPFRVSLPAPPKRMSLPASPFSVSFPAPPSSVSLPPLPFRLWQAAQALVKTVSPSLRSWDQSGAAL